MRARIVLLAGADKDCSKTTPFVLEIPLGLAVGLELFFFVMTTECLASRVSGPRGEEAGCGVTGPRVYGPRNYLASTFLLQYPSTSLDASIRDTIMTLFRQSRRVRVQLYDAWLGVSFGRCHPTRAGLGDKFAAFFLANDQSLESG